MIIHYKDISFNEIDVCLITLNEEENIIGCLDNIYDLTDGINILDGSSQDKTVELIKSYNDKDKKIKLYRNDFWKSSNGMLGDQKNLIISKANSLWVLFIDPDERLNDNLIRDFHKILRENQTMDVIDFIRYNYVDGIPEKLFEETKQMRIFKNIYRYNGNSHHELTGFRWSHYILLDKKYHMIHNKTINKSLQNQNFYNYISNTYPYKDVQLCRNITYKVKE